MTASHKKTAQKSVRRAYKAKPIAVVKIRPTHKELDAATQQVFEQYGEALKNLARR